MAHSSVLASNGAVDESASSEHSGHEVKTVPSEGQFIFPGGATMLRRAHTSAVFTPRYGRSGAVQR